MTQHTEAERMARDFLGQARKDCPCGICTLATAHLDLLAQLREAEKDSERPKCGECRVQRQEAYYCADCFADALASVADEWRDATASILAVEEDAGGFGYTATFSVASDGNGGSDEMEFCGGDVSVCVQKFIAYYRAALDAARRADTPEEGDNG